MFNMTTLLLCISLCLTCAICDNIYTSRGSGVANVTSDGGKNGNSTNSDNKLTIAEGVEIPSNELLTVTGKLPVERNAQPSIKPRKGVKSSISPRKGVELITDELIKNNEEFKLLKIDEPRINKNTTDATIEIDLIKSMNITDKTSLIITEKTKLLKTFKPKPTVTIPGDGDGDSAKPMIGIPTKIPPLGMSSKINYVVPVIVTILVLPLFIICLIFLYRNGRECWEKRHYRRMDFLIDGMYNE